MRDGRKIEDEISVADAHPNGNRPFERYNYIEKFQSLTNGIVQEKEAKRFIRDVQNLRNLKPNELSKLNIEIFLNKKSRFRRKKIRSIF